MARPYLSLIIPTHNDITRIPLTLIDVDRHLARQEYSYEILVVDDGSKDGTPEAIRRFIPLIANLKLIDNPVPLGKGGVIRQGLLAGKGTWRLVMDPENTISIVEFDKMIPAIAGGYEIIIGRRVARNPAITLCIRSANTVLKIFAGRGFRDPTSPFQCFNAKAAEHLAAIGKLDNECAALEFTQLARALKYPIKEIPVFYAPEGPHRPFAFLKHLWQALKIRWWLLRNRYYEHP